VIRRSRSLAQGLALTALLSAAMSSVALAAEPRPWLCRDKPSFSSGKPMWYEAAGSGGRRWKLFLMQFAPGAAHDGFEIIASNEAATTTTGRLEPGRYFVVAMHLARSGHWVCHASARPLDAASRVVKGLCFSDDDSSSCAVTLTVKEATDAPPAHSQATPARQ
jgi:hypothetical protein